MEPNEQFAALVAGKTEHRDVNCRSVDGGYVLAAQRRWTDPATGLNVAQIQSESIAESHDIASAKVTHFLANGTFA